MTINQELKQKSKFGLFSNWHWHQSPRQITKPNFEHCASNINKNHKKIKISFLEKPAKSADYLDIDWIPNINLGRYSKNWKLVEYHFRNKNKTFPAQNSHDVSVEENNQPERKSDAIAPNPKKMTNQSATNNNEDTNLATIENTNLAESENLIYSHSSVRNNDNDEKSFGEFNLNTEEINKNAFLVNGSRINFNRIGMIRPSKEAVQSVKTVDLVSRKTVLEPSKGSFRKFNPNAEEINNNVFLVNGSTISFNRSGIFRPSEEAVQSVKTVGPDARNTILQPSKGKIAINKVQAFIPKGIQTDLSIDDIDQIFKFYQDAVDERNELLTKIAQLVIDFDYFKGNDKKARFYTGLPTWSLLNNFYEMIKEFLPHHYNCKLSRFQMLALTLMKLRLNLSFTDLGYRFRVDETTASRYFHRCIFILFKLFNNSKLVHWPDERKNLLINVPAYFRSTFKEKITIIVDCFETFIEKSTILRAAAQAFSFYKHHETLKYLIGISVTGVILFVSIGFGGRASDKEVVRKSGFLDKIQEGDIVLGDKGFLIEDEIKARKALLKRPSFVIKGCQLHPTEVEQSRDYARIRIHVERVICILREKFNICADIVQMSTVAKQNDLFDRDLYDKIIFICSCLVNICPSVVPNYFEM